MPTINFTPFPTLTTERLTLRRMQPADDQALFVLRADESVSRYIDRTLAQTVDDARKFFTMIEDGIAVNKWVYWALTLKAEDTLIGTICLWNITQHDAKAEIGYELLPEYHGKGIMQEALTRVVEYGFADCGLACIDACVHPDNAPSIRLLERSHFAKVGSLPGNNLVIYALNNKRMSNGA
jgi:[ribosomal protein S5]-alanine N-acetyltransferase